jgi:hypothetical protein
VHLHRSRTAVIYSRSYVRTAHVRPLSHLITMHPKIATPHPRTPTTRLVPRPRPCIKPNHILPCSRDSLSRNTILTTFPCLRLRLLRLPRLFPCDRNVPKHSRRSSTSRSGASHAGSVAGRWWRLIWWEGWCQCSECKAVCVVRTHSICHEVEPHISGVVVLLLRD